MSIDEQNEHPLYKDAHERFVRAEQQQNIKAAAKYPEPLNPASWTAEGLADHAAQEAVDMLRYIEALRAKCEALEVENERIRERAYRLDELIETAFEPAGHARFCSQEGTLMRRLTERTCDVLKEAFNITREMRKEMNNHDHRTQAD